MPRFHHVYDATTGQVSTVRFTVEEEAEADAREAAELQRQQQSEAERARRRTLAEKFRQGNGTEAETQAELAKVLEENLP